MITTIIIYQEEPLFRGGAFYECSYCHARVSRLEYDAIVRNFNYCPFCGAKILGIQKDGKVREKLTNEEIEWGNMMSYVLQEERKRRVANETVESISKEHR